MKSTSGQLRLAMVGVSAVALIHATASFAQDAAGPVQSPAAAQPDDAVEGLEEIVVTAQKRSENIRDVPISITSLSTETLEKVGVTNTLQLTNAVPGLRMERVGSTTIPAIRGVSTLTTTAGSQPNVAIYVDNVYVSNQTAGTFDLPDISRVDVLKGPQGTLFGRNATGGAIQVFTRDPSMDALEGQFNIGYGNFNTFTLKGYVSAPIVPEKLAISVSGFRETADNYFVNLVPSVPLEKIHNYVIRGKLLFTPTDATRVLLTGMISQHRGAETTQFFPVDGYTRARTIAGSIIPTKPYEVASNLQQTEKVTAKGVNLQISQETGIGDFSLLGSWDTSTYEGTSPAFAGALPGGRRGLNYIQVFEDTAYSAELNFASKKFGGFSFIAGTNYYDDLNGANAVVVDTDIPPAAANQISVYSKLKTRAFAVYGEATYELTDALSVIGGIRYSSEERTLLGSTVAGTPATGNFYQFAQKTFNSVTQRASIRYKVTDDANAYFTYSTGFKSGNFSGSIPFNRTPESCAAANVTTPGSCVFPGSVKPEKITAYEVGLKSAITPWINLDVALFYNRLRDIQVLFFTNTCVVAPCPPNGLTPLGTLSNAAVAKMYGVEVSLDAKLSRELRVTGGISLLDASFSSYPNASWNIPNGLGTGLIQAPTSSATGKQLPRAPKATANLSATYTKEADPGTFSFTVNGYASERIYYDVGNVYSQKPYATLGLSASFTPAAVPNLTVTAWGVNITSTRVMLANFYNANGANEAYQRPATYGVRAAFTF
ncbi:TonB-dependent receptor [Sphingomonas sp. MG17]|uniref:TonB-dependent receptor n=1 Tax=Sphingomonas tagetis TaxID=2949092 RepID=A0A9X2HGX8_9SPHN|nr:TonB-dependent receptor [Sphingomonas tagetis]MCP3730598.1 TonB-dependent receptor [Sphingomonas tagetis]